MEQTSHYQLNQYEASDRIQHTDFNRDNQKNDAALGSMVKIASGTYTGAGTYGSGNKNTLTFDFVPKIVFIATNSSSCGGAGTVLINGQGKSAGFGANYNDYSLDLTVTWSGKTLSWYSAKTAERQLNTSGTTYHCVALG